VVEEVGEDGNRRMVQDPRGTQPLVRILLETVSGSGWAIEYLGACEHHLDTLKQNI
jgi:hypothetical protein